MYSVALVLESANLLAKLTSVHIWGEQTGFEIEAVVNSAEKFSELLRERRFDLAIIESKLIENNDYKLLKKFRNNKMCGHIALCSTSGDFEAARNGIVIGIDDYFTLPLDKNAVLSLFTRITSGVKNESGDISVDELFELFIKHDDAILDKIDDLYNRGFISDVLDKLCEKIFNKYEWLDLYFNESCLLSQKNNNAETQKSNFSELYKKHKILLPPHNETLSQIINYILYNPESDLRQKSISEDLHINKSYLSTVFIAQTKIRFVDYITNVKLLRAAWLLKNTDMKISEISRRMDYKDTAYFSKQFKKAFGITPSEYRMPDEYHFFI